MIDDRSGFTMVEDSLDLMAAEGRDLLRRVDLVIRLLGVPSREHPVVPLLRSLRAGPGDLLDMLLATPPQRLLDAVAPMRRLADAYRDGLVAPLRRATAQLGWSGAGHRVFVTEWSAQLARLAGEEDTDATMAGRLRATAEFGESVAGWFSRGRQAMAGALVSAFGSSEAVTLKTCDQLDSSPEALRRAVIAGEVQRPRALAEAAADIGALVLSAVSTWYEAGVESFVAGPDGTPAGGWPNRLADLPDVAAAHDSGVRFDREVWVRL